MAFLAIKLAPNSQSTLFTTTNIRNKTNNSNSTINKNYYYNMIRKYNARYILLEANGNRTYKDIDITYPEDKSRDAVYREERESRRVSNIIANMTGYPSNRIELRELKEL